MDLKINLLPPSRKERLKFIKAYHLAIKVGLNSLFALVVFILFLFFFRLSIRIQTDILQEEWHRLEKSEEYSLFERNKKLINEYSTYAVKIEKNFSPTFVYWKILDKIDSSLPEKTFLKELSIKENLVILKGRSSSRDEFVSFKELLEKEKIFSEIQSPLSNFTSSQNVEFEIIAQLKNKEKK